jgi:hypothetical protein
MRRTRGGFVVCGGCLRHVRLLAFDGSESCPFCARRIDGNAAGRGVRPAQAGAGRGAVVLTALLGLGGGACAPDEAVEGPTEIEPSSEGSGELTPIYIDDETLAPEYGGPGDWYDPGDWDDDEPE